MKLLNLLSLLLDYPSAELVAAEPELLALVQASKVPEAQRGALVQFIQTRCQSNLLDWQSQYDSLFERGRSLSLLLFEHVHGESRDRGQAMVDLQQQYQAAGLEIGVRELPDYIPLYLEFLATQGDQNARLGLEEVAHILAVLACRLDERDCDYAVIFHVLLGLAQVPVDLADLQQQVRQEQPDDTPEALDKVWEEEAVSFANGADKSACGGAQYRPSPQQRRDQEEFINLDQLHSASPHHPAAV